MTYDEAMLKLEQIIKDIESDEALSMDVFKEKAKEANKLIKFCQEQLLGIEKELNPNQLLDAF